MIVDDHIWLLINAFLFGFYGSVHCIGMCGGVSSALTIASKRSSFIYLYNIGRVISYMLAGALVGWLSQSIASLTDFMLIHLRAISGLFVILVGLYIGQFWNGVKHIEKLGQHIWLRLKPLNKHIFPVTTSVIAFSYGLLWGWLPCGLVYSALGMTISANSPLLGALSMLSFGIGTLPSMLIIGLGSTHLLNWTKHHIVRRLIGLSLIIWGAYQLAIVLRNMLN